MKEERMRNIKEERGNMGNINKDTGLCVGGTLRIEEERWELDRRGRGE